MVRPSIPDKGREPEFAFVRIILRNSGRHVDLRYEEIPQALAAVAELVDKIRKSPADRAGAFVACKTVTGTDPETGDPMSQDIPVSVIDYREMASAQIKFQAPPLDDEDYDPDEDYGYGS